LGTLLRIFGWNFFGRKKRGVGAHVHVDNKMKVSFRALSCFPHSTQVSANR